MRKKLNGTIFLICGFVGAYLFVGYYRSFLVRIDWIEGAPTIWDKFKEYYIRSFPENIAPALLLTIAIAGILLLINRKKG